MRVPPRSEKVLAEYDKMSKMMHNEKSKVQNMAYTVKQIRQL